MLVFNWLRWLQVNPRVRPQSPRWQQPSRWEVGREVEALESRVCLSVYYDYDVVAQSGQNGLTSIVPSSTSVNDLGAVAFVGQLSNGQSIFVKGDDTPLTNITPGFISPSRTFRAGIQINNSGLVGAVDRIAGGTVGTVARIWDSASPNTFTRIAQAASPRDPVTQADYFTILQSFASLTNDGQMAFAGQEAPIDFAGNPTGALDFNEIHLSDSFVDRRDNRQRWTL
jgi:hypothetical protein